MSLIDRIGDLAYRLGSDIKQNRAIGDSDFLIDGGGECNLRRTDTIGSAQSMVSGYLFLNYFTAKRTELITQIRTYQNVISSGTLPVTARQGIYLEDNLGNCTLLAAWDNDVNAWRTTTTQKTLSTTFNKVRGNRYAIGTITSTTGTPPIFLGINNSNTIATQQVLSRVPRISMQSIASNLTDLPANISLSALTATTRVWYVELLP